MKKRSKKMRKERNKNRVNRNRNQIKRALLLMNPVFCLVSITLGFQELTTPEKWLARARMHIAKISGNPYFPTPIPTMADLTTKADDLQVAITDAANGDREKILHRDTLIQDLKVMLTKLADYVQDESGGDAEIIISAGFKVRKSPVPIQDCAKVVVQKVNALGTGEIELVWTDQKQAKVFWIEIKTEPTGKWVVVDLTDHVKYKLNGFLSSDEFILLLPGQRYYFRVRGWNKLGFGEYSEVVDAICTD